MCHRPLLAEYVWCMVVVCEHPSSTKLQGLTTSPSAASGKKRKGMPTQEELGIMTLENPSRGGAHKILTVEKRSYHTRLIQSNWESQHVAKHCCICTTFLLDYCGGCATMDPDPCSLFPCLPHLVDLAVDAFVEG